MNKELVCPADCLRQTKSKFMVKGKTITSFFYFQKCLSVCKEEENKKRGKEENLGVCFRVLFDLLLRKFDFWKWVCSLCFHQNLIFF